jgi:polyisoprenoid-binding protein YceI
MDTTTEATNHPLNHAAAAAAPTSTVWQIDPAHSRAEFAVGNRVMLVAKLTVNGGFSDIAGTIELDQQNPANSRADVVIGAASLDTKMARRDKHLKSADFFDVERFPQLTFASRSVEGIDPAAGRYRVGGDLTVRGVTRPVTLDAQYTPPPPNAGQRQIAVTATTTLDRRDFGMVWRSLTSRPADEVRVTVSVQATPAAAPLA